MEEQINPENQEKYKGFDEAVRPAMKWLAENCHPHMKIVIESNVAELLEGQKTIDILSSLKETRVCQFKNKIR